MENPRILVAYYGDDFSGTAATAEALTESGVPTVMFTSPPSPEYLQHQFPRVRAVGISGTARTLPAHAAKQALSPIFLSMKSYRAPINLYKVCSTFDSSAQVGSIGKAIELGVETFAPEFVPVLAAAPKLGRYTVFGHHFAAVGGGEIFRLDRHPSMSKHPVTPMPEADLRRHLAGQTELKSALINILNINAGKTVINSQIDRFVADGVPIVFLDCITDNDIITVCSAIFSRRSNNQPQFMVGSQEVGYGLAAACSDAGLLPKQDKIRLPDQGGTSKGPILVLSGSCATVTAEQIQWARKNGFDDLPISPQDLLDADGKNTVKQNTVARALGALAQDRSIILHTAIGPQDDRIKAMAATTAELSLTETEANEIIGRELGDMAREIVVNSKVRRVVIAGGDTAGRIQKSLQIEALQVARPIEIAAPLCYAYSKHPEFNGLEMAFKGGQAGSSDYLYRAQSVRAAEFEKVALGGLAS